MNWIRLLYPRPHFEVTWGPRWMRRIHAVALTLAYYFSHSLALMGLSLIYLLVILPLKIFWMARGRDPLRMRPETRASYLEKIPHPTPTDFERMF